ncbi:hypothetical protein Bca52824_059527 [Brassica carinata]|uniref:Uncharacterized protein n=2 Tax=Brassica TaxID=3705 RepID=A0A8X7QW26_BRACI|nr:hypothetical protein Bca52824_059527 [Brassica carinata]
MEDSENDHVMSEIHLGCPPATIGPFLSRPSSHGHGSFTVTIQHSITSTLPDVWKSELVLSDFVSSLLNGLVLFSLLVHLLHILPSFLSNYTYISPTFSCAIDHGDQILGKLSLELNSSLFHPQAIVNVRDLNWMSEWPVQDTHRDPKPASFIFAADVIYSDDLTIALFSMLKRVMSLGCDKVLYLGLEKRYNFSLDDLNVVANGYACFRRYIKEDMLPFYTCDKKSSFVGKRIDLKQIPQYTKAYDRGEDVELWEIKYVQSFIEGCPFNTILIQVQMLSSLVDTSSLFNYYGCTSKFSFYGFQMGIALPQFLLDIDGASGGILLLWIVGVCILLPLVIAVISLSRSSKYTGNYVMHQTLSAYIIFVGPKMAVLPRTAQGHGWLRPAVGVVELSQCIVLDILGQYSMVNIELFNIVEEVKKVSKAFVVLPKNVNAENAQSIEKKEHLALQELFAKRLVISLMERTDTLPRVSRGITAEGWASIGSVITVIVLIVIWRVIVYGCKKRREISPRIVPVADVEMN